MNSKLLGIEVKPYTKVGVLEQIKKYIAHPSGFFHIVSLNPENLVVAQQNPEFNKVVQTSKIKIIDGVGVAIAAKLLGIQVGERFTGVELMEELIKLASVLSLRVLLIGGRTNLAVSLSNCYSQRYPQAKFLGLEGISNIKKPLSSEGKTIFSIVSDYKPQIILAAFGSPDQELWFYRHRQRFNGVICMGVGQGFDIYGGVVNRSPEWVRKIGMEWLYRLVMQRWRWRRQLRLVKFCWLVFLQKFHNT